LRIGTQICAENLRRLAAASSGPRGFGDPRAEFTHERVGVQDRDAAREDLDVLNSVYEGVLTGGALAAFGGATGTVAPTGFFISERRDTP
jgi:hypothetical protein